MNKELILKPQIEFYSIEAMTEREFVSLYIVVFSENAIPTNDCHYWIIEQINADLYIHKNTINNEYIERMWYEYCSGKWWQYSSWIHYVTYEYVHSIIINLYPSLRVCSSEKYKTKGLKECDRQTKEFIYNFLKEFELESKYVDELIKLNGYY